MRNEVNLMVGFGSVILIGVIVLIIFGFKRFFELGYFVGKIFCEFKNVI